MVSKAEVVRAFVEHIWDSSGVELSREAARFIKAHKLEDGPTLDGAGNKHFPHLCTVCGVENTVTVPR